MDDTTMIDPGSDWIRKFEYARRAAVFLRDLKRFLPLDSDGKMCTMVLPSCHTYLVFFSRERLRCRTLQTNWR